MSLDQGPQVYDVLADAGGSAGWASTFVQNLGGSDYSAAGFTGTAHHPGGVVGERGNVLGGAGQEYFVAQAPAIPQEDPLQRQVREAQAAAAQAQAEFAQAQAAVVASQNRVVAATVDSARSSRSLVSSTLGLADLFSDWSAGVARSEATLRSQFANNRANLTMESLTMMAEYFRENGNYHVVPGTENRHIPATRPDENMQFALEVEAYIAQRQRNRQ